MENNKEICNKEKPSESKLRSNSEEINALLRDMPLTEDTTCGFWIFRGSFLQKFANQTAYVILYGLVGCVFSMTSAYFNGTITTLEKRFKIPSRNTGIITVGNDISQVMISGGLSYYAGKGHRPRWIGFGLITIVAFCLLNATPHFLYGPGEDALALTSEFGAKPDANVSHEAIEVQRSKMLCKLEGGANCEMGEGNFAPQVVLFVAQFISGIGRSLFYTLGVSYMDDNTKKSKTPALLSLSYFLRMLGPAIGYALASMCLRVYIAPHLHPVIGQQDPRWLGAWWIGWLVLGTTLFLAGIFLTMFPKELPRAVARRVIAEKQRKEMLSLQLNVETDDHAKQLKNPVMKDEVSTLPSASVKDMLSTFKRLVKNKILMCNNLSSVFYSFGYTPHKMFASKYIEIQYRQSAATSSMITGTVSLAFSAIGVLLSGVVISRYKPRARYMSAWNVVVGLLRVAGVLAYAFIGCPGNEKSVVVNIHDSSLSNSTTCNSACHCDYVRYAPVCGENGMTYISPCHAGCKKQYIGGNGTQIFCDCLCIPRGNVSSLKPLSFPNLPTNAIVPMNEKTLYTFYSTPKIPEENYSHATPGACPVNCFKQFVTFLAVMCFLKFVGSTGRASNFLVSVRSVPTADKTAAMGLGMMMMSMAASIPSPIFFGWVIDSLCLVWGKTCSSKGNCWLYNPESLRYTLNFTAAVFITIGTLFDCGVWYFVKDLKIFDEEIKDVEMRLIETGKKETPEKLAL